MSGGFDPPVGDPDALSSAAAKLQQVARDATTQEAALKSGFATSLSSWTGPRGDSFRQASGGIQLQTVAAGTAAGEAGDALAKYAVALHQAKTSIADLARRAQDARTTADSQAKQLPPASIQIDLIYQHLGQHTGLLERQAQSIHDDLKTLAVRTAQVIDAATESGMPGAATLAPAEIARRVDSAMGVTGLSDAARGGTLSPDNAWKLLKPAQDAVPAEDVDEHGEPEWKKILDALDVPVNGPVAAWTVATTPPAGWALYQLARSGADMKATNASLLEAADAIVRDAGLGGADNIVSAAYRLEHLGDAATAFAANPTPERVSSVKAGGIPGEGPWAVAGRVLAVAGIASDVMTFVYPLGDSKTEQRVNQGAAVLNAGATVTVLLAANASCDWIPVVGEVVMIATGVYLAGDWIYNSYKHGGWAKTATDATGNFVTHTAPHAFASGAKKAVGWVGGLF